MRRPRLLSFVLVVLAALAVGACGNKEETILVGHTEGSYLDVGPMQYQVQISRLLNPADREDRDYLVGVPAGETLAAGEAWFAVFMRVQNDSDDPQPLAEEYSIHDTQGRVFEPIELGRENVFAYRTGELAGKEVYPLPSSIAAESTIQGSLLLFKIPYANLENRPLELEIANSAVPNVVAKVDLDV